MRFCLDLIIAVILWPHLQAAAAEQTANWTKHTHLHSVVGLRSNDRNFKLGVFLARYFCGIKDDS